MSTPVKELPQPFFTSQQQAFHSSDEEGTLFNEHNHLHPTMTKNSQGYVREHSSHSPSREEEHRLDDDLAMLQAEKIASGVQSSGMSGTNVTKSMSIRRSRSRLEPVDQFDVNTDPIHKKASAFKPPEHPSGNVARIFKKIHDSSFLIRYFMYIVPLVAIILIPLLLGALLFEKANVGDVRLMWFCVWLEVVWLTLWGGRVYSVLPALVILEY